MSENLDKMSLKEKSEKLRKNEEMLGFSIRVYKADNRLKLEVNNLAQEQLKGVIFKYCKSIINDAINEITSAYMPFVVEKEDYKEEMDRNYVGILNVLLNRDYTFFQQYLQGNVQVFKIKQDFKYNLCYEAGEFKIKGKPLPKEILNLI